MHLTNGFQSLDTSDTELKLCFTLPTGQSFRWHQISELDYHGVIGARLVHLRQDCSSTGGNVWYRVLARGKDADPRHDECAIREYLNLPRKENGRETGVSLRKLVPEWSQRCDRFRAVHPYFPGARMLRQDPVECLFQFICSSNNHISRIGGMVERLCSTYGTPLIPTASACATDAPATSAAEPFSAAGAQQQQQQQQFKQEQEQGQQGGGEGRHGSSAFVTPLKKRHADGGDVRVQAHDGDACVEVKQEGEALLPQASEPKPPPLRHGHATRTGARAAAKTAGSGGSLPAHTLGSAHTADKENGAADCVQSEAGCHSWLGSAGATASNSLLGSAGAAASNRAADGGEMGKRFYAFPTLEQLAHADEGALRAAGFGYRARFIVGAAAELAQKEEGGREWLLGLREKSYEEAMEALTSLPGVGPKVAACVCLFSLDKHGVVPVDTHVWQIAQRWQPSLRGKTLTNKMHGDIQDAFIKKYGEYAGWAHNTLFIAELASQQYRLPPHLRSSKSGSGKKQSSGKAAAAGSSNGSEGGSDSEQEQVGQQGAQKNGKGPGAQAKGGSSEGVRKGQRAKAARTSQ